MTAALASLPIPFDYETAFSRNLGLFSNDEQRALRRCRVAIAGLGGVGGYYLATLARAGIGAFSLADIDTFELVNFNRQYGATQSSVGRPKLDVMAEVARDINPGVELRLEPRGVTAESVDAFLEGVDLVIDAIDLFEVDAHQRLVDAATARGLPVVFAAPLLYGGAMITFAPGGMSFADYFDIHPSLTQFEKVVRFALGLAPAGLHLAYMDLSAVDLENRRGPSFAGACMLCSGMVCAEATTLLLRRRPPRPAPFYQHFDPHLGRFRTGTLRWGNRGLIQRFKRWFVMRRYQNRNAGRSPAGALPQTTRVSR